MTESRTFHFTGSNIMERIREILRKGNINRVILRNKEGNVLLDTTLTIGTAGAAWLFILSPLMVTIAALVIVVNDVTLEVFRENKSDPFEIDP